VSNNRDTAAGHPNGPSGSVTPTGSPPPHGSAVLTETAGLLLGQAVPSTADVASVFVLEQVLADGGSAAQTTGTRIIARRLGTGFSPGMPAASAEAFPAGQVIAFPASSACARCVRDNAPVLFSRLDPATSELFTPGTREILRGHRSFLALPITVRGTAIGLLLLARAAGRPEFLPADANGLAVAIARAAHRIAGSLPGNEPSSSLLGGRSAATGYTVSGLEIAARCLPAAGYVTGGDWYDIIQLPAARTGLIVGDVMGHGHQAATTMTRLRTAARTLARQNHSPAQMLQRLNDALLSLPGETLATCVYAIIDPASRSCVIATAGHLPPVLATDGGRTRLPSIPGGQSLGVTPAEYRQARIGLPAGSILALYSDGLVETRTRPYDQGIRALQSCLARDRPSLEDTCDTLTAELRTHAEDDATVILTRVLAYSS
jgi:hypothetical protein